MATFVVKNCDDDRRTGVWEGKEIHEASSDFTEPFVDDVYVERSDLDDFIRQNYSPTAHFIFLKVERG